MRNLILFLFIIFCYNPLSAETKKVYVKDLNANTLKPEIASKVQNLILLGVLKHFPDSIVIADETIRTILKQTKQNQSLGGGDEILSTLLNSLGFDTMISSDLITYNKEYRLTLNLIETNKQTGSFQLQNKVYISFDENSMEYFIGEAILALKDKNYSINKTNAPLPISSLLVLPAQFPVYTNPSLPELNFNSKSNSTGSFALGLKNYLQKADSEFKKNHFQKASELYEKILDSIETLSEENIVYFKNDISLVQERIKQSYSFFHSQAIGKLDSEIKSYVQNYQTTTNDKFISSYVQEYKKYRALPEYAIDPLIQEAYRQRLSRLLVLNFSRKEEIGDNHFKKLEFREAIQVYKSIIRDLSEYTHYIELGDYYENIQKKIISTEKNAVAYVEKIGQSYLLLADSENSRAILERSMGNQAERIKHKDSVEEIMQKLFDILEKNREFASEDLKIRYNALAREINEDNRNDTVISTKNIALLPFRYMYNVTRSVTDIFVFKFGVGVGLGFEFLFLGFTPFQYGAMNLEASTNYGVTNRMEETGPLTRIWEDPKKINLKENSEANRLGHIIGVYGLGNGQCLYAVVRVCMKDYDAKISKENIDWKKYTTANVNLGLLGGIFIGMELHRIAEIPGVMLFQNPDLFDLKNISKPRKGYFQKEEIPTF